jgi:hypothetical protein
LPPKRAQQAFQFGFVVKGSASLQCRGEHRLANADAFVIPEGENWGLTDCSPDFTLFEVVAKAEFGP